MTQLNIIQNSPVFIHSLWRSGSTYVFDVFRKNERLTCYQEPLNEWVLLSQESPELLLQADSRLAMELRHPFLGKPYFHEIVEISKFWKGKIDKSDIFDNYFSVDCSDTLFNYYSTIIENSPHRPVLEECRTNSRIGAIKRKFGGLHIYLLRNPWDQWWSFKVNSYFDMCILLIMNARDTHPALTILKSEIDFKEFHSADITKERDYYLKRTLKPETSYLAYFLIWALSFLEAKLHADLIIDVDKLSLDSDYRKSVLGELANFDITGISFDDCDVFNSPFGQKDKEFFERQECRAYNMLLESGICNDDINRIKAAKNAVENGLSKCGDSDPSVRAREVAIRLEADKASILELLNSVSECNSSFQSRNNRTLELLDELNILFRRDDANEQPNANANTVLEQNKLYELHQSLHEVYCSTVKEVFSDAEKRMASLEDRNRLLEEDLPARFDQLTSKLLLIEKTLLVSSAAAKKSSKLLLNVVRQNAGKSDRYIQEVVGKMEFIISRIEMNHQSINELGRELQSVGNVISKIDCRLNENGNTLSKRLKRNIIALFIRK